MQGSREREREGEGEKSILVVSSFLFGRLWENEKMSQYICVQRPMEKTIGR